MTEDINKETLNPESSNGLVKWKSPSNIALIKYWGKKPVQLPRNPSISLTLSSAFTITSVQYEVSSSNRSGITFFLDGVRKPDFENRIVKYIHSIKSIMPFLERCQLVIESHNSFPHSSGIASSASAMSALALCLLDIAQSVEPDLLSSGESFYKMASRLSRLGSGSASRSVYGPVALWGKTALVEESSDEYAITYQGIHPVYRSFHDDIVIVSSKEKMVSSSAGHGLMDTNIFADIRYKQARDHLTNLLAIMETDDLMSFGEIVENEALSLHALMMSSRPSYLLMKPNTIAIIDAIRRWRHESGVPIFFTLDAGPNVHILYPDRIAAEVDKWLHENIYPLAENSQVIRDQVGKGPEKLI